MAPSACFCAPSLWLWLSQEVLAELEQALQEGGGSYEVGKLSGSYYSLIPTATGRKAPPPIATFDMLHEKEEVRVLCAVARTCRRRQRERQACTLWRCKQKQKHGCRVAPWAGAKGGLLWAPNMHVWSCTIIMARHTTQLQGVSVLLPLFFFARCSC